MKIFRHIQAFFIRDYEIFLLLWGILAIFLVSFIGHPVFIATIFLLSGLLLNIWVSTIKKVVIHTGCQLCRIQHHHLLGQLKTHDAGQEIHDDFNGEDVDP